VLIESVSKSVFRLFQFFQLCLRTPQGRKVTEKVNREKTKEKSGASILESKTVVRGRQDFDNAIPGLLLFIDIGYFTVTTFSTGIAQHNKAGENLGYKRERKIKRVPRREKSIVPLTVQQRRKA
jgi:hypothetical protein